MGSINEVPWQAVSKIHPYTTRQEGESMAVIPKEEPWLSATAPPPNVHIRVHDVTFHVNKECMASRSARLAHLLQSSDQIDLAKNLPSDPQTFILVICFCYDLDPFISSENALPLACLASYLKMNEEHCPNNLFTKTVSYIETRILPNWNETIKAFKSITQPLLPHAEDVGILTALIKSISEKVASDPNLLVGDPVMVSNTIKRKLFAEEFTSLPFHLFKLVIYSLVTYTSDVISPLHLAQCLYQYGLKWIGDQESKDENKREVIETIEKFMPSQKGLIHVKCLLQLLNYAMCFQASKECKRGFESRIGKQLLEASGEDLCIPRCGTYIKTTKFDTKAAQRILSHFELINTGDSEFEKLCKILEDYLALIASDKGLSKEEFLPILEILVTVLKQVKHRLHDGVYRAIDVYLDAHGYLTEKEREDICRYLDFMRLSVEGSEHAAKSERLPLRAVAQVLFVGQLRIRQEIGELREEEEEVVEEEEEQEQEEEENGFREEEEEDEIEKMDERVSLLENEYLRMKNEIMKCGVCGDGGRGGRFMKGWKFWKEVRKVFGCKSSVKRSECDCHMKNGGKGGES